MSEAADKSRGKSGFGTSLLCFTLGAVLLYGAGRAFIDGKWPGFMPPQLDAVAFMASWLSDRFSAYIAGAIAGSVGLLCIGGGIVVLMPNSAGDVSERLGGKATTPPRP